MISLRTAESAGSNRDVGLTADCDTQDYPMALRFLLFSILNRQSILDVVEPHLSSRFVSDLFTTFLSNLSVSSSFLQTRCFALWPLRRMSRGMHRVMSYLHRCRGSGLARARVWSGGSRDSLDDPPGWSARPPALVGWDRYTRSCT